MPSPTKPKGKRITFHLRPMELAAQLEAVAYCRGDTVAGLLCEAAEALVADFKKKNGPALASALKARRGTK